MTLHRQADQQVQALRRFLCTQPLWVRFGWLRQEGFRKAWRRRRIQRRILDTPPVRTANAGPVEVRVLTWERDWLNALWALKSFYHFSGVNYPLCIHDGGLAPLQADRLRTHFPDATIVLKAEADLQMTALLAAKGLSNCAAYRSTHPFALKLLDFFCLSEADYIISIDSDIVFFGKPVELLVNNGARPPNRYNRDVGYWYSSSLEDFEAKFGIRPYPQINAGLSLIRRESIELGVIEKWLSSVELFQDSWLAEQTLHALCAARHDTELLPDTYLVSTEQGLAPSLVCKHYPGFFRPHLYHEGMNHLVRSGFLEALRDRT